MTTLSGWWAILGSIEERTHIELASRLAKLDMSAERNTHDRTAFSDTQERSEPGIRKDSAAFGGYMDEVIEPPLWAGQGREVLLLANQRGRPILTQTNPAGIEMARGMVRKIGPVVHGPVGAQRTFAVELSGARISLGRDGEVLFRPANAINAETTGAAVTLREIDAEEEIVIPVWWSLPDAGAATEIEVAVKRHKPGENFDSAGAADVVAATDVFAVGKNFRVFTLAGESEGGDTRYTMRVTPAGGSVTIAAAVGVMPRT